MLGFSRPAPVASPSAQAHHRVSTLAYESRGSESSLLIAFKLIVRSTTFPLRAALSSIQGENAQTCESR
jgi:hypothetical protein